MQRSLSGMTLAKAPTKSIQAGAYGKMGGRPRKRRKPSLAALAARA